MDVLMGKCCVVEYFLLIKNRFSRKLMWLKVCKTNHNTRVIVYHFLMCVECVGGN